ncbi:tetratricopeptide repeat protein [Neochlamydia sp. AcF95]|uniref:tetratricopeptide repeat protein n=1 Tax=Neochlamydia sp. AcF95 TaxID=2795734 RepID=UPI001BC9E178|nr:tetratricopeptide repeat protein [Neochlamydia sp. AcF95]
MSLENSAIINPFIFNEFEEIEGRKQPYLKLGPYAEISLGIFKKLGCQDLCRAILVCKEWKHLIERSDEWKGIPLESLKSNELLSNEDIRKAEESYTQALKFAIKEKNSAQENAYIEKLGDIYLRKEKARTFLQAAGLYNYAMHLSQAAKQELLKEKLTKIQEAFSKLYHCKLIDPWTVEKQFVYNRQKLKNFRKEIEEKICALAETPPPQNVKKLYRHISKRMKIFFEHLAMQAIDNLGPIPCEYALIGFGSLAREEMTPYSDLEFGILIQEDTPINKKYFRNLTNLLHLKVINLGETILPALNIPCLKVIKFFDGITPRGFAFDGAGVEGKGCKIPVGNGKTFDLIQTPGKMAQYIGKDEKGQWWHEKEPHLPMELLNFTHLLGNEELTEQYRQKVQEGLNAPYPRNLNLRQYLAKHHLVETDMVAFNPKIDEGERQGMLFKVKNDLYRFPHLALDRLALLAKVKASDTFTRIDQLNEQKIINDSAAAKLRGWMSIVLFMRLKTYSHYQAQQEIMNPILKIFGFEDPSFIQKQFALNPQTLEKIKTIYRIFVPFYQAVQNFLSGNEDTLKHSNLEDNSPQTQGDIALRLFQHEEAKSWYHEAIRLNPANSEALNALALIYKAQGNLNMAAELAMQAFKIDLLFCEETPLIIGRDLNNLATIYQEQGKLDEAAKCAKKALDINRKLLKANHPWVAIGYNTLGWIYQEQGKLKKAAELIRQALAPFREMYGENHTRIASTYTNLGLIYQEQGRLEKAAKYFKRALDINLELYGENHFQVARCYNNRGRLCQAQGKLEKASKYFHQAISINLKLFGENHPMLAIYHNNLAAVYLELRKVAAATEHAKQAVSINFNLFGENHHDLALCYGNLGAIYQTRGKLEKAAKYAHQAFAIDLKLFGENHPSVVIRYNNLGTIYYEKGDLKKAAEYIEKALDISVKLLGENHPNVAKTYKNLGILYQDQGNLEKAAECVHQALAINLKLYDKNLPSIADIYTTFGTIYQDQGNWEKATECIHQALDIDIKLLGKNHLNVAVIYSNLAMLYQVQGNSFKAAEFANQSLRIFVTIYGRYHPSLKALYHSLHILIPSLELYTQEFTYLKN